MNDHDEEEGAAAWMAGLDPHYGPRSENRTVTKEYLEDLYETIVIERSNALAKDMQIEDLQKLVNSLNERIEMLTTDLLEYELAAKPYRRQYTEDRRAGVAGAAR